MRDKRTPKDVCGEATGSEKKNNKLLEAQNIGLIQTFSKKQNVSPDNVFLFKTLHIKLRRHICLTQAVILSTTSNFFATIALLCNNVRPQVKIITNIYIFRFRHTLQRTSHETRHFFRGDERSCLLVVIC